MWKLLTSIYMSSTNPITFASVENHSVGHEKALYMYMNAVSYVSVSLHTLTTLIAIVGNLTLPLQWSHA